MSNYIWVIGLFAIIVLYGKLIDYWVRDEREKREGAKKKLSPIVTEQEKRYNLKGNPILNFRMMSLFMAVEQPEEKEKLRQKLIEIVDEYKMKPAKYLFLQLSRALLYVLLVYTTLFYLYEEPNIYLSYTAIAIIGFTMVMKKRYVMALLLTAVGLYIYPRLSATVMLLLLLNRIYSLWKSRNKKKE